MKNLILMICFISMSVVGVSQAPPPAPEYKLSICSYDSLLLGNVWRHMDGEYYDTLRDITGCDSVVRKVILSVNQAPVPVISGAVSTADTTVYTYSTNKFPFHTYTWEIIGGFIKLNEGTNITVQWTEKKGVLTLIESIDTTGCVGKATIFINNRMVKTSTTTDIAMSDPPLLGAFYPNPSHGKLYISSPNPLDVKIYNQTGMLVYSKININNENLFLSLSPGVYFVAMQQENATYVRKLIIY